MTTKTKPSAEPTPVDSIDKVDIHPGTLVRFRQRSDKGGWSEGTFVRIDDGLLVALDDGVTHTVLPEVIERVDFHADEVHWTPVFKAPPPLGPQRPAKAKRVLPWSKTAKLTDQLIFDRYYQAGEGVAEIAEDLGESRLTVAAAVIACGFEIRPEPPTKERLPRTRKKTKSTS